MESGATGIIGGYLIIDKTGAIIAYSDDDLAVLNALPALNHDRLVAFSIPISQDSYQTLQREVHDIRATDNYFRYSDQYYGKL